MSLLKNGEISIIDRVKVPGQSWSIGVPEGFVFSTDPAVNGKSKSNPSGVYDLVLIKPKSKRDGDFESPYSNSISFVTLDYTIASEVERLARVAADFECVFEDGDLAVVLVHAPFLSVSGREVYEVYVFSQMQLRRCQLMISGPYKKEEKKEFARQLLRTISMISLEIPNTWTSISFTTP